jgi:hypothetical protein
MRECLCYQSFMYFLRNVFYVFLANGAISVICFLTLFFKTDFSIWAEIEQSVFCFVPHELGVLCYMHLP